MAASIVSTKPIVLVTGGSGFIAMHCILQLLASHSYRVRTTLRTPSRADEVKANLTAAGATNVSSVDFVTADLLHDKGWSAAVSDCTYALHVASPFPSAPPKHEDELIKPARDGTLRVLRAARAAGVRRVVVTSSFAAIGYGPVEQGHILTEADWTPSDDPTVKAYQRSKTIAEQAAWEFVRSDEGKGMELAAVNPVAVFGPLLGPDISTSVMLLKRMLSGTVPALPNMAVGAVDVRDVVDLHLRAMTDPKAAGERFLCIAGQPMWVRDIAETMRSRLGERARNVTTRVAPDFLIKMLALFNAQAGMVASELGKKRLTNNEKARTLLAWEPRSPEDSIVATCESLIENGLVQV